MSHSLDDQSSTNYKEAFSLFDKRGTGRVSVESLGDLLRACGQNPTLAEISDLEKNVGVDFDFDAFSRVLSRPGGFRDPGEPEEYCRGFQVFDKDLTGVIGVGQLRYSKCGSGYCTGAGTGTLTEDSPHEPRGENVRR